MNKVKAWKGKESAKQLKPVTLRVVEMGDEVYLSAVDENGTNVVNLINFTYNGTTVAFPHSKEQLENKGYCTDFTRWNEFGSIKLGQITSDGA